MPLLLFIYPQKKKSLNRFILLISKQSLKFKIYVSEREFKSIKMCNEYCGTLELFEFRIKSHETISHTPKSDLPSDYEDDVEDDDASRSLGA